MKKYLFLFLATILSFNSSVANAKPEFADFNLSSPSGESYSLSQFTGKNPVLLVFFATWCAPCRKEVPELVKLQNKYADRGLKILALSVDEPGDVVDEFIKAKGINYTVLLDTGGQVAQMYNVTGIPTNILIDKEGKVRHAGNSMPRKIEDVL